MTYRPYKGIRGLTKPYRFQIDWSNSLTKNLVGFWIFDEGAGTSRDLVSGHIATPQNSAGWGVNRYGKSANVAGGTDYFSVPDHADFEGMGYLTACVGMEWDNDNAANARIIQKGAGSGIYQLYVSSAGDLWYFFNGKLTDTDSGLNMSAGWNVVGLQWNANGTATMRLNDQKATDSGSSGSLGTDAQTLDFGNTNSNSDTKRYSFAAIWRRELSDNEWELFRNNPYSILLDTRYSIQLLDLTPFDYQDQQITPKPDNIGVIDWSNPITKDLVGFWLMNESCGDDVIDLVNHHTGTFQGTPTWGIDRVGRTIHLPADNTYIQVPDDSDFEGMSELTAAVGFYYGDITDDATNRVRVIEKGSSNGVWQLYTNASSYLGYYFDGKKGDTISTLKLIKDKYYSVALQWNNGNITVYRDDDSITDTGTAGSIGTNAQTLNIGNVTHSGRTGNRFSWAAVWRRELTANEWRRMRLDPAGILLRRDNTMNIATVVTAPAAGGVNKGSLSLMFAGS